MRITLPPEHLDVPINHLHEHYAPQITAAAAAFGLASYQHSKLSLRESEAARYRTALINGCNVCIDFRGARDLPRVLEDPGQLAASVHSRGPAPEPAFYENIENWRDWPGYSARERLAIRYAEGLGLDPHGIAQDEDFWSLAKAAFTDDEIVDLSYCIAAWIAGGRVMHALGLDTVCFSQMGRAA